MKYLVCGLISVLIILLMHATPAIEYFKAFFFGVGVVSSVLFFWDVIAETGVFEL